MVFISLSAGCGGGGNGSTGAVQGGRAPAVWAKDICEAFQHWGDSKQSRTQQMEADIADAAAAGDVKEARTIMANYFDDLVAATDEAAAKFRAAGQPAVENGEDVAAALSKSTEATREVFVDNRRAISRLPVDDPARFLKQINLLATGMGERVQSINQTLGSEVAAGNSQELHDAWVQEPACRSLGDGAG